MTNENKLREEFYKFCTIQKEGCEPTEDLHLFYPNKYNREIADWWLSKLHSHTKEVVQKMNEWVKEIHEACIRDQLRSQKYGYNPIPIEGINTAFKILTFLASLEDNKPIEELLGKNAVIDYANNYSHYHCWNQTQPSACGIPLEKHTHCCLCGQIYEDNKK